ncbi:MAG: 3-deoxy-manno-octulosonate-8-phosphatase KdsC [Gammaproteobacteria bacterium]|nr:3-deoxy-manno-octulosonate-8-phosphatase KdsC [Gammaproteobacteria bacterium]
MKSVSQRAVQIKLVIFDVDGVLTDGRLYFGPDGDEYKTFHSRDGLGMNMLQHSGILIGIITARTSQAVAKRMQGLGIEHLYQGQQNKLPAYQALLEKLSLQSQQVAYVGDDLIDLPIMRRVGLAVAVQDAHALVKQHSHWQTPHGGGQGAVRDVCELILEAQGQLVAQYQQYLTD